MAKMTATTKTVLSIFVAVGVLISMVWAASQISSAKAQVDSGQDNRMTTQDSRIGSVEGDVKSLQEDVHAVQRGYDKIGSTLTMISSQITTEGRSRKAFQTEQRSDIKEIKQSQGESDQRLATIEQQVKNLEKAD